MVDLVLKDAAQRTPDIFIACVYERVCHRILNSAVRQSPSAARVSILGVGGVDVACGTSVTSVNCTGVAPHSANTAAAFQSK